VANLLELDDLNEDTLLANIEKRYYDSDVKIYTWIGSSILVALNPYQKVPIYTVDKAKECRNFVKGFQSGVVDESARPEPHLFMVAEEAYQDLVIDKQSQSIIVTGESGAGKTEATKVILSYLARWKDNFSSNDSGSTDLFDRKNYLGTDTSLEKQVLDSNPLLEAFGNAKTVKNDNSSRFGKFIQVNVERSGKIISATIRSYLLEKSRIVHQNSNERNFHIFYYVFIDPAISEMHGLKDPADYTYLENSFIDAIPEEEDQMGCKIMKNCMKKLGFSNDEYNEIIDLVVGILSLGNIRFDEQYVNGKGDESYVDTDTEQYLEKVTKLFGSQYKDFIEKVNMSDNF